jgi:hypothetical protein
LPAGIESYAIGAVAGATDESVQARLVGDGLVPLDSALCRHPDPRYRLPIPAEHQWVALRTNHLELQTSPEVYKRIKAWLSEPHSVAPRGNPAA